MSSVGRSRECTGFMWERLWWAEDGPAAAPLTMGTVSQNHRKTLVEMGFKAHLLQCPAMDKDSFH